MTEKVQGTRHNPNAIPDKRVTVKSKDLPATLFPYPTCLRTTPTPLRLSPRQTSQPTSHFVPPKTFSQNKTHQNHHFVPLNRFIWNEIQNLFICVTIPRLRPSLTAATTDGVTQPIIVQRLVNHPHTTSLSVPSKTFSQNKTHQNHHFVPLNRFIWDKTLRFSMA